VLESHPAVREAAAVVRGDGSGEETLVAYVTVHRPVQVVELLARVRSQLAPYAVPSRITILDALPRFPNGKLDRSALRLVPEGAADLGVPLVAPRTDTEAALVEIWREVLGVDVMGITQNFFELGGNSLRATQVLARIHNRFVHPLTVRAFFEVPTVEGLARLLDDAHTGPTSANGTIPRVPRVGAVGRRPSDDRRTIP